MFIVLFYILCILLVLLILFRLLGNKNAKQICRILDRLFIDIVLRKIVENYDSRHKKIKRNVVAEAKFHYSKEIERLQNISKDLLEENKRLNVALENCEEEKEYLSKEMNELKETNEIFSDSIADLRNTIRNLSFEKNKNIVNNIPGKTHKNIDKTKDGCLYAEPDATGTILRKISANETKYSLFRLELLNEQVCKFYVLNNASTPMYINNRSVSLLACQILEVAPNPTKFEVVEAGTAVKNNNNWIVMEPAKIKIL